MPAASGNDFHLNFSSNAAPFARELEAGLGPGIDQINALKRALAEYEAQAESLKGGRSPLGLSFDGLDASSARLEKAGAAFATSMTRAMTSMGTQISRLEQVLARGGGAPPPATGGNSGFTPEQQAILRGQQRSANSKGTPPAATQVTPAEQAVADSQRRNAESAVKAVKDLATANESLATQASASALAVGRVETKLQELWETAGQFNDLRVAGGEVPPRLATNSTEIQIGNSTSNPVPVVLVGGEAHPTTSAHHGPPPTTTATTATSNKAAQEEIVAATQPGRSIGDVQTDLDNLRRTLDNTQRARRRLGPDSDSPRAGELDAQIGQLSAQRAALQAERTAMRSSSPAPAPRVEPVNDAGSTSEPASGGRRRRPRVGDPNRPPGIPDAGRAGNLDAEAVARSFAQLDEATRQIITEARAHIATLGGPENADARGEAINRAGAAFRNDSMYREGFQSAEQRRNHFSDYLGLDSSNSDTQRYVRNSLKRGGTAEDYELRQRQAREAGTEENPVVPRTPEQERLHAIANTSAREGASPEEILAQQNLNKAMLATIAAQEKLAAVTANAKSSTSDYVRAQSQLITATQQVDRALAQQADAEARANAGTQERTGYQRLTGRDNANFGRDLVRRGIGTLEHQVGYQLVFSGFEKLREVVHDGIEAQAAFARLQASLDANGISAGNLRGKFADISATTATPIEHVIEAAAELSGTLKNASEISFGANIAAQLANISQGTLTAKEAAVGLRDVIAAYGEEWAHSGLSVQQGMQNAGDQIAHLSQLTGVSVKDITEGTTQIAQEASEFGLNQRQAATLSAYVTKGTGETGEQAASQTSRLLSTLYNGRVQTMLERTKTPDGKPIATEQEFASGKIGEVLQNLIANYSSLSPQQRQQIASQMGTGITARAFGAITAGGKNFADELSGNGSGDKGALNKQNEQYLNTISGATKQLDEDFQNLGNSLQRLGALDAIGILAKTFDELLRTVRQVMDGIASIFGSNPLTAGLMHWSVILLEAAAAWKVFGGAATNALVRAGAINPQALNLAPVGGAAGAEGAVAGAATRYERAGFGRLAGGVSGGLGSRMWGTPATEGAAAQTGFLRRDVRTFLPGGMSPQATNAALTASEERLVVTTNAVTAAHERIVVAEQQESALKADASASTEALNAAIAETTLALEGLTAATLAAEEAEAATASMRTVAATGAGTFGSVGALGARLNSSFLAKAAVVAPFAIDAWHAMGSAGNDANNRSAAADRIMAGSADPNDRAALTPATNSVGLGDVALGGWSALGNKGFRDYYFGDSSNKFVQAGTGVKHTLEGLIHESPLGLIPGVNKLGAEASRQGPSQESSDRVTKLMSDTFKGQKKALPGLATAGAVKDWVAAQEKAINDQSDSITKAGGNDKRAQAAIQYNINQLKGELEDAGQQRINALQGLQKLDQLTVDQTTQLLAVSSQLGSLNDQTLRANPRAIQTIIAASGVPVGGAGYNALIGEAGVYDTTGIYNGKIGKFSSSDGSFIENKGAEQHASPTSLANIPELSAPTMQNRLKAQAAAAKIAADNAQAQLDAGKLGTADQATQRQNLNTALQQQQSANTAIIQNPIAAAGTRAQMALATGGTTAGGDAAAVGFLGQQAKLLTSFNKTLDKTDPQYWANLMQIQQIKQQIAHVQYGPQVHNLMIAAAGASDSVAAASLAYQQAQTTLAADRAGGASSDQIANDQAGIASAGLGTRRAEQGVTDATSQANMAGIRNQVGKAQAQLNQALQHESVYRSGGLADAASYQQAVQQETEARQAIADAIQAEAQSEFDVTLALQKQHGDAVGSARTALQKANQQYAYAVAQYGQSSIEANAALAQAIQAQTDLTAASLAQVNSYLDLDIALLNARGKSGDAQAASSDAVAKARNAISSYLHAGGKGGTQQYNQLMGELATAQRTAFDTALNAQLDTLDFQQQTYQITSGQEVAALQQILQNKQLTLKEQRDITLKIKSLQDSIRSQLTEGGLNIPSDIKLPTAYEVRRSMGAGFGGSATQVSTVNNNQQVTVNNNVPNAQVAAAIANSVIAVINQQTGAGLRSSSSTPRTVATR